MLEPVAQIETTATTTAARAGLRLQATHGEADRGNDHYQSIHQSTLHEITLENSVWETPSMTATSTPPPCSQ
jgi:hypothetical protein